MPSASPIALPRPPCSTQIGLIRFPKYSPTFTPIGGAYSRVHRSPAQWRKRAHTARSSRSARPTGTDGQRRHLNTAISQNVVAKDLSLSPRVWSASIIPCLNGVELSNNIIQKFLSEPIKVY